MPESQPGFSSLDRAWALRLGGDGEGALRLAASILLQNPAELGAGALCVRLLLDADRAVAAGEVCDALVARYTARGDLPGACYAANLALEAGGYTPEALRTIASAFGKGSPRLSDGAVKPPPFPSEVQVAPHFAKVSGEALLDAVEKALAHFKAQKPADTLDGPLPKLPLFSELPAEVLQRFLGALEVRELAAGRYLAQEGEPGDEAFILVRGLLNVVRGVGGPSPALLASLGPGAIFGEMALVSAAPRAASVVAVEPAVVLSISRPHLEGLSTQDPAIGRELGAFCHRRMVSNLMRHSAVLSAVSPAERGTLMARFRPHHFATGDRLVRNGEPNASLLLIASGTVEVRSVDGDGDRVVIAQLGPGEVVGEISLVLRRPATADVVALHPTVALELTATEFQDAIRSHPELLRELYELALHRDDETRSVVAQQALDVSDVVLV